VHELTSLPLEMLFEHWRWGPYNEFAGYLYGSTCGLSYGSSGSFSPGGPGSSICQNF